MGAGLLLAGVAGAAVVHRRRGGGAMPSPPRESEEHAALEEILERSVAYNEALYQRVRNLETVDAASARPAAVAELTERNREERAAIDALRAVLQNRLAEQGSTFADVEGFVPLISKYRGITLSQQKRHLEVYRRVRKMENMPSSPELHAYLKLGYSNEEQKQADTDEQLRLAAEEQRTIMLRVGRMLDAVSDASSAGEAPVELKELGTRYKEISERILLYKEDDPLGAVDAINALKSMYGALTPALREQVARLREHDFYGNAELREVLNSLLP